MKALKKVMRPELINRLDSILVFHALTKKNVEKIFDNLIDDLRKRLASKGVGLKIDEKAKNYLKVAAFSKKALVKQLLYEKFTNNYVILK